MSEVNRMIMSVLLHERHKTFCGFRLSHSSEMDGLFDDVKRIVSMRCSLGRGLYVLYPVFMEDL